MFPFLVFLFLPQGLDNIGSIIATALALSTLSAVRLAVVGVRTIFIYPAREGIVLFVCNLLGIESLCLRTVPTPTYEVLV